jgi:outer membrane receptor protein involved in Fe transport
MKGIMSSRRRRWAGLAVIVGGLLPSGLSGQEPVILEGRVEDAVTSRPVAGVLVRAAGRQVLTGRAGSFRLLAVPDTATVQLDRLGYAPVWLRASDAPPVIRMAAAPVLLSTLSVGSGEDVRLARGTALSVATVKGVHLHATGRTTVAEGLERLEGVSVARMGSWGARPVLRGLTGERVAVLIDGQRVTRGCAFGMDQGLSSVDPAAVERVEVLTGPGSALYGSGNIGGVINVVTRPPSAPAALSGEFRTRLSTAAPGGSIGGQVRMARDPFGLTLAVNATRHGDYSSPAGAVDESGFRHVTANLSTDVALDANRRLSLQTQAYEGRDIGWPAMPGASIPRQSRRSVSLDYGHQLNGGVVDGVSARAYIQRLDHEMLVSMDMGGDMPMTSDTEQRSHTTTTGGRVQLRLVPGAVAHVDVGLEGTRRSAEATRWTRQQAGMMPPTTLELHTWPSVSLLDVGAFAQGEVGITDGVVVSAGGRLDRVARDADGWPSTAEQVVSGNVGARLTLPLGIAARATLGRGYRTPDPTELFGLALRPDGFIYLGNPDLVTETGTNLELGLDFQAGPVAWSVTGFRNDLDHLIAPVVVPEETIEGRPVRSYDNVARARLEGVSGTARWSPGSRLAVRSTATYTRGEDLIRGLPLAGVPPLEGDLAVRIGTPADPDRWMEARLSGAARHARPAEHAGEVETPDYLVLDLNGGFRVGSTRIRAGVENVLDQAYRGHLDPQRLLRPGRGFYLSASVPFNGAI